MSDASSVSDMARARVAQSFGVTGALGFIIGVSGNARTNTVGAIAFSALALIAVGLLAMRMGTTRWLVLPAVVVALVALWLLPQRDDAASAVVLAALFGAALGLMLDRGLVPLALTTGFGGGIVVLVVRVVAPHALNGVACGRRSPGHRTRARVRVG